MQLLTEPKNKFDLFTIKYPKIEEFGNKQLSMMWLPGEISYDKDRQHFEELKDERIRHILKRIIGFFFTSDGIVFANLDENFTEEFKAPEMKYLLFLWWLFLCYSFFPHPTNDGYNIKVIMHEWETL